MIDSPGKSVYVYCETFLFSVLQANMAEAGIEAETSERNESSNKQVVKECSQKTNSGKEEDYALALKKFADSEVERRKVFDSQLEEKRKNLTLTMQETSHVMKIADAANVVRRKIEIDREVDEKVKKLWSDFDKQIAELRNKLTEDTEKMKKEKNAALQLAIDRLVALHQKAMSTKKKGVDEEKKRIETLYNKAGCTDDTDTRAFLKKYLVDYKEFPTTPFIQDEDALKRLQAIIHKKSIFSGKENIIYRGQFEGQDCAVKVILIGERSISYRKNLAISTKVARFLCKDPAHQNFGKILAIFLGDKKTYTFVEELDPVNLEARSKKGWLDDGKIKQIAKDLVDALEYMHYRAFAHLNVSPESVTFNSQEQTKLVGFGHSFVYFDINTESFLKSPRYETKREFIPAEAYADAFEPQPVDVFSLAFVIYAMSCALRKKQRPKKISYIDAGLLEEGPLKALVTELSVSDPTKRPTFADLKNSPFFE